MSNGTTVELTPGQAHQFKTNNGTYATLAVTNENTAGIANFAGACNTAAPEFNVNEQLEANGHWSSNLTDFGGGQLLVVNTTNPNNPSTISVTFSEVGSV